MNRRNTILIAVIASATGCASIGERNAGVRTTFPGTRFHNQTIQYSFSDEPTQAAMNQLGLPFAVLDYPFSLVLDTILFPYDFYSSRRYWREHPIGQGLNGETSEPGYTTE